MRSGVITYNRLAKGEMAGSIVGTPPGYQDLMQNCHVSPRGGIAPIPGYSKINATTVTDALTSGFEFVKIDGSRIRLHAGAGKVYKEEVSGALTVIHTFGSTTAKVYFAQMGNKCVFSNGQELQKVHKYDGTTVSDVTIWPANCYPHKPHLHKGRMWWSDSQNKMIAWHSALNNCEDYTAANDAGYLDLQFTLKCGDKLVVIKSYMDLIVFFFSNAILIYSGTIPSGTSANFALTQMISGVGIIGDSAIDMGMDLIFLHGTGVKTLRQATTTGNLDIGDLSAPIDSRLKHEIALNTNEIYATAHYVKKSAAGDINDNKDHGWLMLLINNKVWLYSYKWKAWGRMIGADVNGMFGTIDGQVYLCGTGFVYLYGSGWTFAGTNPEVVWITGWIPLSRANTVAPAEVEILGLPRGLATLTLEHRYDYNEPLSSFDMEFTFEPPQGLMDVTPEDAWDESFLLDHVLFEPVRLPLMGEGRAAQFRLSGNDGKPWEIMELRILTTEGGF